MSPFADQLVAFSSERLSFQIVCADDANDLQAITNHRTVTDPISFLSFPFSQSDCQALIDRFRPETDRVFVGRKKSDGTLVSLIGAHLADNKRVEIGYWIGAGYQGQGYGYEAAAALLAYMRARIPEYEIFAECAPDNLTSKNLLVKLGFAATNKDGARVGRKLFVYGNHSSGLDR